MRWLRVGLAPAACRRLQSGHWTAPSAAAVRGLVTAQKTKPVKRFYKAAQADWNEDSRAWRVLLDGKPVRTPKGSLLFLPTEKLAESITAEWSAQDGTVRPQDMPLTTLACTTLDLVQPEPAACVDRLIPYLMTDTLCFEDGEEKVAQMQRAEWGPVRQWFEGHVGVTLAVTNGLLPPAHGEGTVESIREKLLGRSEWDLCSLEVATHTAKSLVVGLALLDREDVEVEDALRWALLEEHLQIERWGLVEGAHDVAHDEMLKWLVACRRFVAARREG
eukprot:CAMPEP_0170615562 /NCGR_PEP_ID=MMETSP0224-20130122/25406_1 /TAXON_ID=285029 /ORGANISM="Togula jolla, Strain CCCM 725" /LENGTH=275 /DNA_ID=CAMNT_0010941307 /DNA_START=57 /DNA_END=881 /DNA_ORIENTATION=-